MFFKRRNFSLLKRAYILSKIFLVAGPDRRPCALSVSIKRATSSGTYIVVNAWRFVESEMILPIFFFLEMSRVNCASENPAILSIYSFRMVLSFFRSEKYLNRPSTVSIHSYFSLRDVALNSISFEIFMNSLICAILIMRESFIVRVISSMIPTYAFSPNEPYSGSFCVRIKVHLGLIVYCTRLRFDRTSLFFINSGGVLSRNYKKV